MAEAGTALRQSAVSIPVRFFQLVPGTILLAVIGYAGKVTEQTINAYGKAHHLALPNIEYVLWAIVFGVLGFLAVSTLATLGVFSKPQIADLANLSRWAFLPTFAGVGLRTDLRQMRKQGLRPFVVGALGELAIAGVTLGMVVGASKMFAL